MDAAAMAAELDRTLRAAGTPARAEKEKRYLKSELRHHGTPAPAIRKAVTALGKRLPRTTVLALVRELWREPVHERRAAAVVLLERHQACLEAGDLRLLERLLRESRTWALLDALATLVVGPLVERSPELGATLDRWATDPDFWMRRAAMLSLLLPLRQGRGDFDRFGRYADAMLGEKEFFIRKAIGWILRETGRKRPELVAEWLAPRARRASGLTFREASRNLPAPLQARLQDARA